MAELARPKLSRNLAAIVGLSMIALFAVILVLAKGSDFGQSAVDAKRAAQQQQDEAKKLQAKIENPSEATLAEYTRAKVAIANAASTPAAGDPGNAASSPSVPTGMPGVPPVSQYDLERLERAQKAIEAGRNKRESDGGDDTGGSAGGAERSTKPGFVMYQAGASKEQQPAADFSGNKGEGENNRFNQAFAQQDPNNDPRLIAEKQRLAQYAQAQAQGSGDTSKSSASGLDANSKWLFATQSAEVKPAAAIIAQQAKGLYWLAPGTAISAVLLNAVDTKLPGQLVARVTQNIYDSRYGRHLVIPAGSTLQGKYNSSVQEGQDRVLMVFDTLVTPAGGMVPLGNMSAADALGRAGLEGDLHTHFFERLGIATLLALEAVGMDKISPNQSSTSFGGTTTSPAANGAQIIVNTANQELQHRYNVAPNITMPEGAKMTIITTGAIEVPPIANTR